MSTIFYKFVIFALIVAFLPLSFVFLPTKNAHAEDFSGLTISQTESVVKSVVGDFGSNLVKSSSDAYKFFDKIKDVFQLSSSEDELIFKKEVKSLIGSTYKFGQKIDDIEVFGAETNLSVKKNFNVSSIMGVFYKDKSYDNEVNFTKDQAEKIVEENFKDATIEFDNIYIYDKENFGYVAYLFNAQTNESTSMVVVSAKEGKITQIISKDTLLRDKLPASGYSVSQEVINYDIDGKQVGLNVLKYKSNSSDEFFYVLADKQRRIYMTNGQNKSDYSYKYYDSYSASGAINDDDALKAYQSLIKCYDFYADEDSFGITFEGIKNSYGRQIDLIAIVHFDKNYENAGYVPPSTGSTNGFFIFGDGSYIKGTSSFVNGLDIVGHEYQHALTEQICDFVYQGESGALSEAFSDMFGAVIEGKGIDSKDFWLMGEDVVSSRSKVFRDMSNPSSTSCASDYNTYMANLESCRVNGQYVYSEGNDHGKIHYNCTLPTYATYLMYKNNPQFFTEYNILGLWYQTLTKLTKNSGISDFCSAMMLSANELGYSEETKNIIEGAFASVGIPGYSGVKTWNNLSLTVLQGEGNIASPYLINSVADLATMSYLIESGDQNYVSARYKLNADLEIKADIDWLAIGTEENPFNGYFNGVNHTITVNLNVTSSMFAGIFGIAGEYSYIYDLNVAGKEIVTKSEFAGAIASKIGGTISGCSSSLSIQGDVVGGLAGKMTNSDGGQKISNCYVTSALKGSLVGGLVGEFETLRNDYLAKYISGYLSSCYFSGTIEANVSGGLVARANGIYVINCIVTATLNSKNSSESICGGLVGDLRHSAINSIGSEKDIQNFVPNSKVAPTFTNYNSSAKLGYIAGNIQGSITTGITYLENNVIKRDNIKAHNLTTAPAWFKETNTKLSQSKIFEGDFDFDNIKFYETSNWFVLNGLLAFDTAGTFKINYQAMPTFKDMEFWLDSAIYNFAGSGTEQDPYKISNASQLAGLASILTSETGFANYSDKYYELTADIDLAGKIWVSIGIVRHSYTNNLLSSSKIYGFQGNFDGKGFTIKNMNTLGLVSVQKLTADGNSYNLIEFGSGLFGTTQVKTASVLFTYQTVSQTPTIKNLKLENISSSGNYASGLVSKAFGDINIENVSITDATITSSGVASGLVGKIEGQDLNLRNHASKTVIKNSYVFGNISGTVASGAIGYVTNISDSTSSSISVINFLSRGKIVATGTDSASRVNSSGSYAYYRPIAGSVVGVTLANELKIINSINLADILSYSEGAYLGGFVGSVGVGDSFKSSKVSIYVDGSKQMGKICFAFDQDITNAGAILGGTHSELSSNISIDVSSTTFTIQDNSVILYSNSPSKTSVVSSLMISTDQVGTGDFDIYNPEYYSNSEYFNSAYMWTETEQSRLFLKVTFYVDGVKIHEVTRVKEGESVEPPEQTPTKNSTVQYDYIFDGWDSQEYESVDKNLNINAVFRAVLRSYTIEYVDNDGNVIDTRVLKYGDMINQNVKAPEKKGNFFIKYSFVRWGSEGQEVRGDASVKPTYKIVLTSAGSALVTIALIVGFIVLIACISKKTKVRAK